MKFSKLVATTALAVTALGGLTYAQDMPEGRVYTFHSKAQGGCPALDWHIVATEGGRLEGMFSWNNMKSMAHATGNANMQSKTFHMTAKEVGGQGVPPKSWVRFGLRMATWSPRLRGQVSAAMTSLCRGSHPLRHPEADLIGCGWRMSSPASIHFLTLSSGASVAGDDGPA